MEAGQPLTTVVASTNLFQLLNHHLYIPPLGHRNLISRTRILAIRCSPPLRSFHLRCIRSAANRSDQKMAMALLLLVATLSLASSVQAGYVGSDWISGQAHATYYGGADAAGTQGGACGFGNLWSTGYGTNTAALSAALFNSGLSCGACYELKCDSNGSKYCLPGNPSITITATNFCPQGSEGGWCDTPKQHFDMAHPAFTKIAQEVGGVFPVIYRRVPCVKQGGMRFQINGNPWFLLVLVTNVGGAGDVQQLQVKGEQTGWYQMVRNWGQMWQFSGDHTLPGTALSFRATLGDGTVVESPNCAPKTWGFQQTFEGNPAY